MLRISPHVINCQLQVPQTLRLELEPPLESPSNPLLHTQLESLEIEAGSQEDAAYAFNALAVPAARDLTCIGDLYRFPHESFFSLVSRSSCSLQTLSLNYVVISNDELIQCLRVVPSLRKLSLSRLKITNETFWTLNPSNPDITNGLLPVLESFHYNGRNLTLDFHILMSFLYNRSEWNESTPIRVARLESVEICSMMPGVPSRQSLTSMRYLVQKGMKISITTADGIWP
jgi:hypothetical protein